MKILFVDDTLDTRQMFKMAFEVKGHETHLAHNGLEAVEAVRAQTFDALVIDAEMPLLNGVDSILRIRELSNGAQMPIVLLTAFHDIRGRLSVPSSVDILLYKPILPSEVLENIEILVEARRDADL